jgi:ribonuclease Z
MKTHIQFVVTPTSDTPGTAIILQHEVKKYMFGNLAEGTQRACIGHGVRLSRLSDIFLTGRSEWTNTGGSIGMILTLADVLHSKDLARAAHHGNKSQPAPSKPVLGLHGPRNLKYTLAAARRFIFRKGLPLKITEFDIEDDKAKVNDDPTWTDDNIKVWHLPVEPKSSTVPRTRSPTGNKRSFSELQEGFSRTVEPRSQEPDKPNDILDHVIDMMFDSTWSKTKYVEIPLPEVSTPAAFFQRSPETGQIEPYNGPLHNQKDSDSAALKDTKVLVRSAWPGANVETLPTACPSRTAMSYIVRNHSQRGKFLPQKAKALGIQPGVLFKTLASGQSVTAENGSIITPEMVLEPSKEGRAFAIIDLPSEDYVDSFLARRELASEGIMEGLGLFVWILGPGVIQNARLKGFMEKVSDVKHIISSREVCPNNLGNDSSAAISIRLSQVAPDYFPVPLHSNVRSMGGPVETMSTEQILSSGRLWEPAQRGLRIQVEPTVERDPSVIVPFLNTAEVLKDTSEKVLKLGREAQQKISELKAKAEGLDTEKDGKKKQLPGRDNEITTLGTGSAMPSKYRNVSANLLRIPGKGSYLFDCGEGTLGQLRRLYATPQLQEVLRDLKMIWISHLHADHHLGTTSMINAWVEATSGIAESAGTEHANGERENQQIPRLHVIADRGMLGWIREYFEVENVDMSRVLLILAEPPLPDTPDMNTLKAPRGLKNG